MAESPATLIDKLIVIHLKYWHYQDIVQECKKSGDNNKFAEFQIKIDMCNQDRNELMAELDDMLMDIMTGKKPYKKFRINRFHDHGMITLKKGN